MAYYSRRLPHWQPEQTPVFITWALAGSIPPDRFPPPHHRRSGEAFVWMDRFLDQATTGIAWLRRDDIAEIIVVALRFSSESARRYELHSYVVMPNHVHILVSPQVPLARFMQSLKGFTACEANKLLGRAGEPFWQHESYDHWVRNDEEFGRIVRHIEENPVRAGLVANPEDYRWSSAYAGRNAGMAG